jgi:hypothetical protein
MLWYRKLNLLMLVSLMLVITLSCTQNQYLKGDQYLKEEPSPGYLRHEQVVFVDDGTCPAGEIKKVTGGNMQRSIPRQVQCIKRPQ